MKAGEPIFFSHIFRFTENLQTEIEVWSDMKKLKHLPIPLSQKKTLRQQYQVRKWNKIKDLFHEKNLFFIF